MTTVEPRTHAGPQVETSLLERSWKVPIALGLFAALAVLLFVIFGHSGRSVFSFTASNKGAVTLPTWTLSVRVAGAIVTVIAVVMAALSAVLVARRISVPIWYVALYALAVTVGFLAWATTHHTVPITGLLVQSLALSTPLIFGALGGVISERVGVVNVAIEGQLLAGAFVSAVVASLTGSVIAGIVAAMAAGMLVSFVLATFAIKYAVNQIIVGIVLNGLVLALTTFLYQTVLVNDADTANSPPQLHAEAILMYVAVAAVYIGLFRTRWGLRVRAVGEHPQAADTVGINVARTRFWNVALAGAIVGMGGAYFTLGNVGAFTQNVTSGAGYIALAAVIFGRWDPLRASMAALLFGFANELQFLLNGLGSPVPSDILLMLPYLVTIFAVAGLVGSVRGPAAAGRPYLKS
jgi:ABC-type uncharacterized transport system permease subunit